MNEDQEQRQPDALTVMAECGFCQVETHIYADEQTDIQALFTQLGWGNGFLLGFEFDICPTCVSEMRRPQEAV